MAAASQLKNLRLMETFRNLFYTPIYVAVSGSFFYRHGLNVMFSTMPEGAPASAARYMSTTVSEIRSETLSG